MGFSWFQSMLLLPGGRSERLGRPPFRFIHTHMIISLKEDIRTNLPPTL